MLKTYTLIALLLITAALIIGCGGSSSNEPLTRAEYVEQASAICQNTLEENQAALADLTEEATNQISKADQERFFTEEIFPQIERATEELGDLSPPSKTAAVAEEYVDDLEASLQSVESKPALFASGKAFTRPNAHARMLGLQNCVF